MLRFLKSRTNKADFLSAMVRSLVDILENRFLSVSLQKLLENGVLRDVIT